MTPSLRESPLAAAQLRPIEEVAADLGLSPSGYETLGRHKAKVNLGVRGSKQGSLLLVSAIGPTKAGEGKTTVSVGLADGLRRLGKNVALALREPSLGPVFGVKGGGTGGGCAQVEPADDINLHFTGDLHAIGAAHNLLAALVDNDLHFGGASGLTPETTTWPRVLDVNDRALRQVSVARGSRAERATRFDITAASEVMAVLALASDLADLRRRLARIVVGRREDASPVTADDLGATDAMLALLKDALKPNLVQTREGSPAFVHAGPFGNIAHGCSSVVATASALSLADLVISEAGFGFDLGGEKFLDIKMRQSGLWPHAVVLVATVRALTAHGGGDLGLGLVHLQRQLSNVARFGLPCVVALNLFPGDREHDLAAVEGFLAELGVRSARFTAFREGGAGAEALGREVVALLDEQEAPPSPRLLYRDDAPLRRKLELVAQAMYGAEGVDLTVSTAAELAALEAQGFGSLPVCIAKTHLSFSADPKAGGLATGFRLRVHEVRLAAGAGFVVALMGEIVTMPALPREPAAKQVRVAEDGRVTGLMQGDGI